MRPHPPRWSSWAPATHSTKKKIESQNSSVNNSTNSDTPPVGVSGSSPQGRPAASDASATSSSTYGHRKNNVWQNSNLHANMTAVVDPNPFRDPAIAHCSVLTNDASRCQHLEECMFPRFLTLDCNQLDDFTIGRVECDGRNPGRIYIESLHLKDFLKDPETILSHHNTMLKESSGKLTGKRARMTKKQIVESKAKDASPTLSKKKKIQEQTPKKETKSTNRAGTNSYSTPKGSSNKLLEDIEKIIDPDLLSQSYFGGMEGKRTWILANNHKKGMGGGIAASHCQVLPSSTLQALKTHGSEDLQKSDNKIPKKTTSDEKFKALLSSEIRLVSLRKAMKLHDRTAVVDNFISNTSEESRPQVDREMKALESLIKPLPGFVMPSPDLDDDEKDSNKAHSVLSLGSDFVQKIEGAPKNIEKKSGETNGSVIATSNNSTSILKPLLLEPSPSTSSISTARGTQHKQSSPEKKERGASTTGRPTKHRKISKSESLAIPEPNYDRALREGKQASLAANLLLESFRRNRRAFWAQTLHGGNVKKCLWCPSSRNATTVVSNASGEEFGVIRECTKYNNCSSQTHGGAAGDGLIQCLECDMTGCGPTYLDNRDGNNQHAMLHFLMSGHKFGEFIFVKVTNICCKALHYFLSAQINSSNTT